ncbi:MAG: glycerate kinase [Lachnospiraceae bacterium]
MSTIFCNYEQLVAGGNSALRKDVLDIVDAGVKKVIPYEAVKKLISYRNGVICIGTMEIPDSAVDNIYIVGAGKGSFPIAKALNEILGSRIRKGFVAVKEGEKHRLEHIEIFESSHPIPDERSITAADRIIEILNMAGERDLVFAAITGGSSALVNKPAGKITIENLQDINTKLLNCGAEIGKINTVRKHLCLIKGGRLVQYGQPAMVITLTFDTAPPDMPWPDMCLPDPTTFEAAVQILKDYNIWNNTPESIKEYLLLGRNHPELETVKTLENMRQIIFSVADPRLACGAAAEKARELGYEPYVLSTIIEGEAKDVGMVMAGMTDEILESGRPFNAPCALISGGETTVTIQEAHGVGGPNQETVLGFAEKIRHKDGYAFVSMDTDGTDGPCNKAGGIADGSTIIKAKERGIHFGKALHVHDSASVLERLGDDLVTGHTGTNVMNLRVVVIKQ